MAQEADLKTKLSSINTQQSHLLQLRTSDPVAYNAAVPGYNQQVDAYNAEAASLRNLISSYNQLVATRNAIALEEDQLVKELSSNTAAINK